jgi:hypothetical protein
MSAVRVAFEYWIQTESESEQPLQAVLRDTLRRVAAGLPPSSERNL